MAVTYIRSDLEFILQQIKVSEAHAAGEDLTDLIPNSFLPWGLRTVDGSMNNLVPGNEDFGAADELFPRLVDPDYRDDQDGDSFDANGPAPGGEVTNTDYGESGDVADVDPRIISNLIVDQTSNNEVAAAIAGSAGVDGIWGTADDELNDGVTIVRTRAGVDGVLGTQDDIAEFQFDNTAPDEGLSASFNLWFVFFGQFFDHGLDQVEKGGNGFVFVPLQPDDPLVTLGPDGTPNTGDEVPAGSQFMVLERATPYAGPGADGILGTADDTTEHLNQTSPFVDQNQTYASHASHQVFLRAYEMRDGAPVSTGGLLTNRDLGADGVLGTGDDVDLGGMSTWGVLKAQARDLLGINLTDEDVGNVPLLATDEYGNFIRGPNGYPQVVMVGPDGLPGTADDVLVEGNPAAPIDLTNAVRTGQQFLSDIAHSANPFDSQTGALLTPDADDTTGDDSDPSTYDDELLDAHFVAGDGRANENVGLTAVHQIFHSEHNRLVEHTKQAVLSDAQALLDGGASQEDAVAFLNEWLAVPVTEVPTDPSALAWNGERLFQAAKFGTEMQYQHLVFEEFARKIQPNIDEFFLASEGFVAEIDPSIVAEFAHVVYRFGHSMLTDEVDRLDPNFASSELGLIEAFLNPLAFNDGGALTPEEAAGAIIRGTTRQAGNEIDEFVTEALRNNLLGLPLDLAAINIARGRDTGVPTLNAARRDFHAQTGDSQLKAYESWIDFMQGIKHPASIVNFIAAYGTHAALVAADVDTLAEMRAVATALVVGGSAVINEGTAEERTFVADDADRLDFLHGSGSYANIGGVTVTGVDDIDFWIGGLAEKNMPFGGMLGTTFNFVFETQLEALQSGDRFYYLARLEGTNFLSELENNSFSKMLMEHTNVDRLPADAFSTPDFILEADQSRQFNADVVLPGPDGILGDNPDTPEDEGLDDIPDPFADPVAEEPDPLNPLVIRDNPLTPGADTNYLEYTGGEHVVLGGTDSDDILIGGAGDDTVWGDGGNDLLEGGFGNDTIEGGAGDDIITDTGGDDVLKGNAGNDVIHGGQGINLLIGGFGSDFIITGDDADSDTFAGPGNDFILGSKMVLPTFGGEGDDWIEIGTQDGAAGDNLDPLEMSGVIGHDVFVGGGGFDEMMGEGGDDIMVGSDGEDHFAGGGGFDWASYENDAFGVKIDLDVSDLIEPPVPASNQGVQDRFAEVEGLVGSAFSDILLGSDADATEIDIPGTLSSALTDPSLIAGLQGLLDALLGPGTSRFGSGNIILAGGGGDIIEGRGGDDLIDGDSSLNVRVSVRENIDGTGAELFSVESITELVPHMMSGAINPGQLVIVREILSGDPGFDTAVFTGTQDQYEIIHDSGLDGVLGTADDTVTVIDNVIDRNGDNIPDSDGVDRLVNVERLQFSDGAVTLDGFEGLNNGPEGQPTIDDTTPEVGQEISASALGITDADNPGGAVDGPIAFFWQVERDPVNAPGVFLDIVEEAGANPTTAVGDRLTVTEDLDGLRLRVKAIYQDANGTLETVFSQPTDPVAAGAAPAPAAVLPDGSDVASEGIHLITRDLQFILDQIKIAEQHTAGEDLLDLIPNARLPFGLRTVDGSFNNLVEGQTDFGAADQIFPRLLDPFFNDDQDGDTIDINGPAPGGVIDNTDYGQGGDVVDADPRIISNLIADQTSNNPAAVAVAGSAGADGIWGNADDDLNDGVSIIGRKVGTDGLLDTADDIVFFAFDNEAPDEGLSAPFNMWFVFFGQFFDHGLDLVVKGDNGTVFIPLQPDDPLIAGADGVFGTADDLPPELQFMVLTRATTVAGPGADGIVGDDPNTPEDESADDTIEHVNNTTPWVDQNQTYASTPSHQVFLRAYQLSAEGRPVATGRLITNHEINPDGTLGADLGGMSTWGVVKAQARDLLGIQLTDHDAVNVPLLKVDAYGNFIPGANGFAQIIVGLGADGIAQTDDDVVIEGDPSANGGLGVAIPVDAPRTGHPFLADIAHSANPFDSQTGLALAADADAVIGDDGDPTTYDDELLAEHFMGGDGRTNENVGLTAVHHIFHSEHNRLVQHVQDVILASAAEGDLSFLNEWLLEPVTAIPADLSELVWNGERLFQAARFGTEMQYQHLVFEEFARKVAPQVDIFLQQGQGYDATIDASIVAEFAHVVYRFGHSMLAEDVDRYDPSFASSQLGLIEAFLNPTAFDENGTLTADEAAGAIVRGTTRQAGNEVDEFKTEALRNNLLGLPLDLGAINLARGRETGIPSLNAARATFYEWTGDSKLKAYESWVDFMQNLKHPESLVNFIAAYGTHELITGQTTLEGMRAAAYAIVMGESVPLADGTVIDVPADRLDFLYSTGTWANGSGRALDLDGVTTTGLGSVDFWIGGLAEQVMPFGGLLGSTFGYVFEEQLEALQNGDRFYYLERVAGLNFLTELESSSFRQLIEANTDTDHLAGDVFSTPAYILEVDQSRQFNANVFNDPGPDGILGDDPSTEAVNEGFDDIATPNQDPLGDNPDPLNPEVIRDNPETEGADTNYLEYNGGEHVVLGGTDNDDILISSIGDDTLHGDAGNDLLEGGDGNDFLFGGDGDDILTDTGGDDNLQGGDGNDAMHGGNGINLLLGGFGNDFIVTGEDANEAFAGVGNDFVLGAPTNELIEGNEGDDWIEGPMSDGGPGDNFDDRGLDQVPGNDIFMGTAGQDRMIGEGGDDVMMGNGGQGDRYIGASGFDWATFARDEFGANVDMSLRAFDEQQVPPSEAMASARFEATEGLAGSAHSDMLRGDDESIATIPTNGAQGSTLTNFALIDGLQELIDGLLGPGQTSFAAGNIIMGGAGSDIIEGRGGDDLIDGDLWLNVRISVRENPDGTGAELFSVGSMTELVDLVFSGEVNPGQLVAVREILDSEGFSFDTAHYSDTLVSAGADGVLGTADDVQQYTFAINGVETAIEDLAATYIDGDVVTVTHLIDNDGDGVPETVGVNGTDTLRNIERLQFSDQAIVLADGLNAEPVGAPDILGPDGQPVGTPAEGETLSVSLDGVTDADNVGSGGAIDGPVSYVWQVETVAGTGVFEDIIIDDGLGEIRATGPTYDVSAAVEGRAIRVKAIYRDENGVLETVFSAATAPVQGINDAPTAGPLVSDPTPEADLLVTAIVATIVDPDGTDDAVAGGLFTFQWQQSADGITWVPAVNPDGPLGTIDDGTGQAFLPGQAQVGMMLRVEVTYTDDGGAVETVTSAPTQPVHGPFIGTPGNDVIVGTIRSDRIEGRAGDDILSGLEGNDLIYGEAGNDTLEGGEGDDGLSGGDGDDVMRGGAGSDQLTGDFGDDVMDGGTGADRMEDTFGGNDTYVVDHVDDEVIEIGFDGGKDTIETTLGTYALDASPFGVENLTYTGTGDFTGTGNGLDNAITGGAGNDTLDGGTGNDELKGEAGNDALNGGAGADIMTGGTGNDTYIVDDPGDQVIEAAGEGTDAVQAALNAYTLAANVESLTFTGTGDFAGTGNALDNAITGGAGNDTLDGGAGADTMTGGAGDDSYVVDDAGDQVTEAADDGTDTVRAIALAYVLGTHLENLTFIGEGDFQGTGNDLDNVITGGDGNDRLNGNSGNDTLDGGAGADLLRGGAGDDTYVVDDFGDRVLEGARGTDTVHSLLSAYVLGSTLENLTFTGTGSFSGVGNDRDNIIIGGDGGNSLVGGVGNDTLQGGDSNDSLAGGAGNDVLTGGLGNDNLSGGTGNDTLDGGLGNDAMAGGAGNDTLNGGAGDDIIDGGDGDDTIEWSVGDGRDIVNGAAGTDSFFAHGTAADETFAIETVADYLARTGTDPNDLQAGTEIVVSMSSGAGPGAVVAELSGIDDIDVDGGGGNDTFIVSGDFSGTDLDPSTIFLTGSDGDDTLDISGRDSDNRVVFDGGGGTDAVVGEVSDTDVLQLGSEAEPLNLVSGTDGRDRLRGSNEGDLLDGAAGNDRLYGGRGDDLLVGGDGNDIMLGGAGNDTFEFAPGFGNDVIISFDANSEGGQDLLDLSALGITAETFADNVTIGDHWWLTQISIGDDTINLFGVKGGSNAITQDDFILA